MIDLAVPQKAIIPPASLREALSRLAKSATLISFHDGQGDIAEQLSYSELYRRALKRAAQFRAMGCEPGQFIGLTADTSGDFLAAFFGCQYAGLVPVPVPVAMYMGGIEAFLSRLSGMLDGVGARVVIANEGLAPLLAERLGRQMQILSYEQFGNGKECAEPLPEARQDIPAYVQFSSGSTGSPKGILISQQAVCRNATEILVQGLRLTPDDRAFSWLPFYHDMGLVGFVIAPLIGDCPIHYISASRFARQASLWLQLISKYRCSISYAPSFGYRLAMQRAKSLPDDLDLSSWRVAGIGGDFVRHDVLTDFAAVFEPFGFDAAAFLPSYGMAEAVLAISFAGNGGVRVQPCGDGTNRQIVSCGVPLPSLAVELRDADGVQVPSGESGLIHVKGPSVAPVYIEESGVWSPLDDDGFLDTGDLGFWRDGELWVSGRAKDLIIHNGRNIWPQDLEAAVEAALSLRTGEVAAFELDWEGLQRIMILVQSGAKDGGKREELCRTVVKTITSVAGVKPEVYIVRPHCIPKTSSGKTARQIASEKFLRHLGGEDLDTVFDVR